LITVAAIAREGESSAITPCAEPTRTINPNTANTKNRFIHQASGHKNQHATSINSHGLKKLTTEN
jgi:hypothetical protein